MALLAKSLWLSFQALAYMQSGELSFCPGLQAFTKSMCLLGIDVRDRDKHCCHVL